MPPQFSMVPKLRYKPKRRQKGPPVFGSAAVGPYRLLCSVSVKTAPVFIQAQLTLAVVGAYAASNNSCLPFSPSLLPLRLVGRDNFAMRFQVDQHWRQKEPVL